MKKDKTDKFLDYKNLTKELLLIRNLPEYKKTVYELYDYAVRSKKLDYIARAEGFIGAYYCLNSDFKNGLIIIGKALIKAKLSKNNLAIAMIETNLGSFYYFDNNYKKAIFHLSNSTIILKKLPYDEEIRSALFQNYSHQGTTFALLGLEDLSTKAFINSKKYIKKESIIENILLKSSEINALEETKSYLKLIIKGKEFLNYIKDKKIEKDYILDGYYTIATSYLELNQIVESEKYSDSLDYKLNKFSGMETKRMISIFDFLKGKIFLKKGNLNESEKYLNKIIVLKNKDNILYADANNLKGEIYEIQKKNNLALNNYEIAYKEFLNLGNKRKTIKVVLNIIELCLNNNQYTKVKEYLPIYTKLKDEIFNEQVAKNMTAAEVKYETELKESKIKSQQLELEKEKTNKYIALTTIGILIFLSIGGFLFYRNKQKEKELQTQNTLLSLQQNINGMELQNLNQQLNPHEIKNLLASISPEIQEKAPESYRKMLKLFNITKASLNNHSITDSIENQVQQIDDFLSLEKNMLIEPLEYSIHNDIEDPNVQIPRLLLKNLVENSIKHGIKGQEKGGKITINLQKKDHFVLIEVDDTGKGRKQAISLDSGIGTSTYQKLFATLNLVNKAQATFEIKDKQQGTKVEVKIPMDYKYS
ncbi:hypothetical protein B0A58_15060 [Flavobacterium branchiophilum NBRC 15030 = ATCC 35035]|nr:hypothetical protein B0A58_15060 [Flavobacterium branchiophilum NBRC 15030 = ATCC 35035]GEM56620.1 hypothetical protein FB1_28410 [Flavobacterium branchiophilum NBRC 15030 = ATCC 35035]